MFAIGGNKYMFDMLFDSGELDPCIIVFITYYMDPMRDADVRILNTSTSEIKICMLVPERDADRAYQALLDGFEIV